jgi:hypothetical protein
VGTMYSYSEFIAVTDKAKELALKYKDMYDELYSKHSDEYHTKYRSGRTIHNLEESIRPDLMSIHRDMCFFDFSRTWRVKKQRMYKISRYADGRIQSIFAGDTYREFFIYEKDAIILADYSADEKSGRFSLESQGCGTFSNDKLISFFVAEIDHIYSDDIDYHLKCEQYDYCDDQISAVTTYDHISTEKITFDENVRSKLGYVKSSNSKCIKASPQVYIDDFIYDENKYLYEIHRRIPYKDNIGTAIIKVKSQPR